MESATTSLIVLKELAGNIRPELNYIQEFLLPHINFLVTFWISVWIMTAIILFVMYIRAYRKHRSEGTSHL